ncbi:MAG: hypothetical protein ACR2NN_01145 [Bryobacteraceae bacterium]
MKKLTFMTIALAASLAHAATSYRVNLYRPTLVNGTELKAGEVKVELHDNKASFKQGKTTAEANVKVENGTQKFISTTVGYGSESAANDLQEIRLGGTSTKLVFEAGASGNR